MPESNIESTASKDNSTSQQKEINNAAQSWQNAPIQQDTSFQNALAKVMQSNYVRENLLPDEEVIYRGEGYNSHTNPAYYSDIIFHIPHYIYLY